MAQAKDGETLEGTQEQASSESSKDSVGQQRSVASESSLAETVQRLQQQIDSLVRGSQSEKDRAVKKTNQRIDALETDIRTILQSAQREGKSVGDLLSDIEDAEERETRTLMREMASAFKEGRFPGVPERQSGKQDNVASEVLAELELDPEDMRVKAFAAKQFESREQAFREGAKLLKTIATTQPSDADRAVSTARQQSTKTNQEKLLEEYREGSKGLYGRALMMYKQQMRSKGLEIT